MPRYYPVALNLEARSCLVVGGGKVAERRIRSLLEAGARVTAVAPEPSDPVRRLAEESLIELHCEPYVERYLEGAFLVVAATDRPEVNQTVITDCRRRGILCGDAESPDRGDFVVPSTVRRGGLLLAATTGGRSPSLAARIAVELAERYGPEYADYVELLGEARELALRQIEDAEKRRVILRRLVEDESILSLLREGRGREARERAFSCISSSSD